MDVVALLRAPAVAARPGRLKIGASLPKAVMGVSLVLAGLGGKERGAEIALAGVRQDHHDGRTSELRPPGDE